MNGITSRCELSMLWLTLSKGELGQQRQQEGGTPDIDFQFDFDFKIWGVLPMNFNNSRLVDHKPMKFGTFVPNMYRFVIIVKYLTNFFKLE